MASRTQRRKQLELIKRAIIPAAVRPPLRQVVVRDGVETSVVVEGDVNSEHWDRFPNDAIRQINFRVIKPEDTELGRRVARKEAPEQDKAPAENPDNLSMEEIEANRVAEDAREQAILAARTAEKDITADSISKDIAAKKAREARIKVRLNQLDAEAEFNPDGGFTREQR